MTAPFLGDLKSQLTTGRQRLRRRRRMVGASVLVLAVVGSIAVLTSVGRDAESIKVSSDGPVVPSIDGTAGVLSETTATSTTLPSGAAFDPWQKSQAERSIQSFLTALTSGTESEAAALLSEYAVVTGDGGDALATIERFRTENGWTLHPTAVQMTVTPSFSWSEPNPVVTVVGRSRDGDVEHALAFVVARDDDEDVATLPQIVRLPAPGPDSTPRSGATVAPGATVFIPGLPGEGGATAYVDGYEIPVDIDDAAGGTRVTVPKVRRADVVLTVSLATPEEPTARAVWFRIGDG